MRSLIIVSLLLTATIASADQTWAYLWNHADSIERYEAAAEAIEYESYLSISGYAASPVVPIADKLRATNLEVEFAWFYLAKLQLDRLQEHKTLAAQGMREPEIIRYGGHYHHPIEDEQVEFQRTVRRLSRVPDLHVMSKLMIARARELDDPRYGYDIGWDIKIPSGEPTWLFVVGFGGTPLDDFRDEYKRIARSREPSVLAFACVVTYVACFFTLRNPDASFMRNLLENPIGLIVRDSQGVEVKIRRWWSTNTRLHLLGGGNYAPPARPSFS